MTNLTNNSFVFMFISILYMFRAFKCTSSGGFILSIRYLLYVTLCRWPSGMQVWTILFCICLFQFSTFFVHSSAHHQEI